MSAQTENSRKRKFVIDSDAGIDDAQAILLALSRSDVDVCAITTVHGNVKVGQVARNVLRLLKVAGRLDDALTYLGRYLTNNKVSVTVLSIPVYKGSEKSLLGNQIQATYYHGFDGFGDVPDKDAPGDELLEEGFAVSTLIRLANEHKGDLELICLGPLTNVALAIRMDPHFGAKLKHCYIMGGNYEGKGNISCSAEFNFYSDPEAAHVVLSDLMTPITMACWELCLKYSFSWEWYNKYASLSSTKAKFIQTIESNTITRYYKNQSKPRYTTADQILLAIAVCDAITVDSIHVYARVELSGALCRGQMIADWKSHLKREPNVTLVTAIDHDLYGRLLMQAVEK